MEPITKGQRDGGGRRELPPDRPYNETLQDWEARMKRTYNRPVTARERMKKVKEIVNQQQVLASKKPSRLRQLLARLGGHKGDV